MQISRQAFKKGDVSHAKQAGCFAPPSCRLGAGRDGSQDAQWLRAIGWTSFADGMYAGGVGGRPSDILQCFRRQCLQCAEHPGAAPFCVTGGNLVGQAMEPANG